MKHILTGILVFVTFASLATKDIHFFCWQYWVSFAAIMALIVVQNI